MKQKGIALITTMIVVSILAMLMGAFLVTNRSQFQLLGGAQHRDICLRTAVSAHEYCLNRLQRDQTWGRDPFPAEWDDPDLAGLLRVKEVANSTQIEGEIPALSSTFTVSIDNRLAATDRVVLTIVATSGHLTRTVESTLRPAPLYDAGLDAGGGISVNAPKWNVASRDPYRNVVRARGDINAPDYSDVEFISRQNSGGQNGSDLGIFWSKTDITFYQGTNQSVTDPVVMQNAVNATGGRFIPNSGINNAIHDIQASDVVAPASFDTVASGDYVFTEVTAEYEQWVQIGTNNGVPEYGWELRSSDIPILGRYSGGLQEYWYSTTTLPNTIQNLTFGVSGTPHQESSVTFGIENSPIQVTLETSSTQPTFRVNSNGGVDIPGEFGVRSDGQRPNLEFQGATSDTQIRAQGDININGDVNGTGVLVAQNGDVNLNITNAVSAGNQLGVSVFADGDININTLGGQGDLEFNGLVFARNSVVVNGGNQRLVVDGAVVARSGNISINSLADVDITYNPEHLEVLLETLPDQRVRLETLVWKES